MGVTVSEASENSITLAALLAPNINHLETVFGGSISTLATLSAWSLIQIRLAKLKKPYRLVIQENSAHYTNLALGAFTARSVFGSEDIWDKFQSTVERRGIARISITSLVECEHMIVGNFSGDFVALE